MPSNNKSAAIQVNEQRIKPGAKLAGDHEEKSLPVVRRRLYLAGVRLADVLNEAFANE